MCFVNIRICFFSDIPPPVSATKLKFLNAYKRPIPSIYNTVLQELIVQQHLMKYQKTYRYDAVFALGFVTVYDQLMDGYPSEDDREAIFQAYVKVLNEDPQQYRSIAKFSPRFYLFFFVLNILILNCHGAGIIATLPLEVGYFFNCYSSIAKF
ncbi:putative protein Thf1 [Helianthus annuus]|nr:putative protein Thf1 [Helianthus annuus]